jgi:hypothetical protein
LNSLLKVEGKCLDKEGASEEGRVNKKKMKRRFEALRLGDLGKMFSEIP